ncbi:hypothetical protein BCR42DRAFT_13083 [Absidia repens]|uniref:SWIM-type domain-containing protein n=1 Tax=Absidia repens TaxID=90262 RepID=A0A1X2J1H1_9FUNG|nr:hypothetical protein BCR42DRAFT_13083 [Absidia repens]
MTYDQIRVLHSLLGDIVLESLHLLDTDCVSRLDCEKEAKRQLYKIQETPDIQDSPKDSKDRPLYSRLCMIYPEYHCSCDFFIHSVVCEQTALMCRHVLATILYETLNDQQNNNVLNDDTFARILYTWNTSRS